MAQYIFYGVVSTMANPHVAVGFYKLELKIEIVILAHSIVSIWKKQLSFVQTLVTINFIN